MGAVAPRGRNLTMGRIAVSPAQRAQKVAEAIAALPAALAAAQDGDAQGLPTEQRHALWAVVEEHGATVHRNGRLLAGKSKGG
jgi:phosphohistidine phosphatase SixA